MPEILSAQRRPRFIQVPPAAARIDLAHTRRVPDLVLYDGGCGLCHRSVSFLARRDRDGSRFLFAPLGGETARTRLGGGGFGQHPAGTVVVLDEKGAVRTRSDAVLHVLDRLGGGWRIVASAMRVVPRPLRDVAYLAVARIRGRLFARPQEACPRLPLYLASRFLP
jgi:predicted DCC family thiol-disulfide oxidoreductase YuxK